MKTKVIMITAIVLLSVWAVLATITAVDNENRRSRLYDECKEQERTYERLQEKYEAVEEERDALKADKNVNKYLGLAYEISFEALTAVFTKNDNFDIEQKIDEVVERENLNSFDKKAVCILAEQLIKRTNTSFE